MYAENAKWFIKERCPSFGRLLHFRPEFPFYKKNFKIFKKSLQLEKKCDIVSLAVTWHTMKREVAGRAPGFSVENVRFLKLGDSHCTLSIKRKQKRSFCAYLCPDRSMSGFMFVKT